MRTEDDKIFCWKGNIIKFYPLPNFEPIRYLKVGLVRVLPYELSWLYENIIEKILYMFKLSMTVSVRGYHKYDIWKHIKIRTLGYVKMLVWRVFGILLFGSVIGIIFFVGIGQFLLICNLFSMLL